MREKEIYEKLRLKMREVSGLPGHPLGRFTPYYREVAPFFKVAPWRLGVILAFLATFFLLFLLGPYFIRLASLLSRGF